MCDAPPLPFAWAGLLLYNAGREESIAQPMARLPLTLPSPLRGERAAARGCSLFLWFCLKEAEG
jgi:hypothetical protein